MCHKIHIISSGVFGENATEQTWKPTVSAMELMHDTFKLRMKNYQKIVPNKRRQEVIKIMSIYNFGNCVYMYINLNVNNLLHFF